jgi:pantothenate kinase
LVGIAGVPGSGKSSLAVLIVEKANHMLDESHSSASQHPLLKSPRAILVGLDGWHLTRAHLDTLPDPKLAHDRRGSHWTFDSHGYVLFIRALREQISFDTTTITAPSFDHALKDPSPDAITILPQHRIVIIEGLYSFLSLSPWREAGMLLDERWLLEIDPKVASDRIVKRHVASGIAKDLKEAQWRSTENDTPSLFSLFSAEWLRFNH